MVSASVRAEDSVEALTLASQWLPEVIVSDVLMPKMVGFRLCQAVHDDPRLVAVPVLLLSAVYDAEADRALACEVGASELAARSRHIRETVDLIVKLLSREPQRIGTAPMRKMAATEWKESLANRGDEASSRRTRSGRRGAGGAQ